MDEATAAAAATTVPIALVKRINPAAIRTADLFWPQRYTVGRAVAADQQIHWTDAAV
jgi:hypothetical protein